MGIVFFGAAVSGDSVRCAGKNKTCGDFQKGMGMKKKNCFGVAVRGTLGARHVIMICTQGQKG